MGYKIEYNRQHMVLVSGKAPKKLSGKRLKTVLIGGILTAAFVILQANGGLLEVLFPGEGMRARQAMEQMVDDIRAGESFQDAFEAFCIEIIDYA